MLLVPKRGLDRKERIPPGRRDLLVPLLERLPSSSAPLEWRWTYLATRSAAALAATFSQFEIERSLRTCKDARKNTAESDPKGTPLSSGSKWRAVSSRAARLSFVCLAPEGPSR